MTKSFIDIFITKGNNSLKYKYGSLPLHYKFNFFFFAEFFQIIFEYFISQKNRIFTIKRNVPHIKKVKLNTTSALRYVHLKLFYFILKLESFNVKKIESKIPFILLQV